WLMTHKTCASLWTGIYSTLNKSKDLLSFDPEEHRSSFQPQVSLAAQILLEAVQAFNTCRNLELEGENYIVAYGIRVRCIYDSHSDKHSFVQVSIWRD